MNFDRGENTPEKGFGWSDLNTEEASFVQQLGKNLQRQHGLSVLMDRKSILSPSTKSTLSKSNNFTLFINNSLILPSPRSRVWGSSSHHQGQPTSTFIASTAFASPLHLTPLPSSFTQKGDRNLSVNHVSVP